MEPEPTEQKKSSPGPPPAPLDWPEITEPLLRERQAMTDEEFFRFLGGLLEDLGERELEDAHYELAISYPWDRPSGSCLVTAGGVEPLADIGSERRAEIVERYLGRNKGRIPLLAYGANGSPERLALKLEHLPEGDREALVIAGWLEGFDIGAAAQPPIFLTMPATLFPSPGTAVRVAVLFLTPVQFTTLWWTELSYTVGALSDVTLTTDVGEETIDRVILFVSRYGAFCVEGEPVALSALPARSRRSAALTQLEILEAAAAMVIGEGSSARDLLEAAFESPAEFWARHRPRFHAASAPFASEHWAALPA